MSNQTQAEIEDQIFESLLEEVVTGKGPPDLSARILAAWEQEADVQFEEQVFDALLEEVVTGNGPPDLSAKILNAWEEESASQSASPAFHSDVSSIPLPVAVTPTDELEAPPVADSVERAASSRFAIEGELRTSRALQRFGVIAGGVAIALAIPLLWIASGAFPELNQLNESDATDLIASDDGSPAEGESDVRPSELVEETRIAEKEDKPRAEVLPLDNLPFESGSSEVASNQPVAPTELKTVAKLDAQKVISESNRLVNSIWEAAAATPAKKLQPQFLVSRTVSAINGVKLDDEQVKRIIGDGQWDRQKLVQQAVNSNSFAAFWSERFASDWLSGGRQNSEAKKLLGNRLKKQISAGAPVTAVVGELLAGDLQSQELSEQYFVTFAGGENHRVVESIGSNFLDVNMACSRCHESGSGKTARTQEDYWSMVAMLSGIRADFGEGGRLPAVFDRQMERISKKKLAPTAFYDLPTGVLKAAAARFPNGQLWELSETETPRAALANWVEKSTDLDRAIVSGVWKTIFGRRLVPLSDSDDQLAISPRIKLRNFLADQFRAHNRDLGSLVSWVVSTDAFGRTPIVLTREQWLNADEELLRQLRIAELAFAAGPTKSEKYTTVGRSIASVIDWRKPSTDGVESVLGQPSVTPQKPRKQVLKPKKPEFMSSQLVLHADLHLPSERRFVQKLLSSSNLSWEESVQHIVALRGHYGASGQVQRLAKELLEHHSGDAEEALLDLLSAVRNASS